MKLFTTYFAAVAFAAIAAAGCAGQRDTWRVPDGCDRNARFEITASIKAGEQAFEQADYSAASGHYVQAAKLHENYARRCFQRAPAGSCSAWTAAAAAAVNGMDKPAARRAVAGFYRCAGNTPNFVPGAHERVVIATAAAMAGLDRKFALPHRADAVEQLIDESADLEISTNHTGTSTATRL